MNIDQLAVFVALYTVIVPAAVTIAIGFMTYKNNARKQDLEETNAKFDNLKEMVEISHDEIVRLKSQLKEALDEIVRLKSQLKEALDENQILRVERDDSLSVLEEVKQWAENLVHTLKKNGIEEIQPMPDKQATKPRKATA